MCGRFTQHATWAEVAAFSRALTASAPEFVSLESAQTTTLAMAADLPALSWNVAPSHLAGVLLSTRAHPEPVLRSMRWGLSLSGSASIRPINARSETVAQHPYFRAAYHQRRCLVPVTGWFEWKIEGRVKQPYWFHPSTLPLLYIAGIWQAAACVAPEEQRTAAEASFAILTTAPLAISAPIHDRSPVLLDFERARTWLDPLSQSDQLSRCLDNARAPALAVHAVSRRVGHVSREREGGETVCNDPNLIAAIAPTQLF